MRVIESTFQSHAFLLVMELYHRRRNTCSAVYDMFLRAFDFSMESSNVAAPLTIEKKASIPASLQVAAPSVTAPANAIVFIPY